MKGIKRDETDTLDSLIESAATAVGVSLIEIQIKFVVRLRKLMNNATSNSAKESVCADIAGKYIVPMLQWLLYPFSSEESIESTGRFRVVDDIIWLLTAVNNSTMDFTEYLIKTNTAGVMLHLLRSPHTTTTTIESALWIIGSLAACNIASRDRIIKDGALDIIVNCLAGKVKCRASVRLGAWAVSHLCGGFPKPAVEVEKAILPWLIQLLESEDEETISHACWSLSHIIDGPSSPFNENVVPQMSVERCEEMTRPLITLLSHSSWRITKPALRVLGNIVCSDGVTDFTQVVVDGGILPHLSRLIHHSNRDVRKEACWTLSNIAAGTVKQIQAIIDVGVLPAAISIANSLVARESEIDVWTEACWVLLNAASCGSDNQIHYLVKNGIVGALSGEMLCDSTMVTMALEGLERVLRVGEAKAGKSQGHGRGANTVVNPYAALLSEARKARSLTFDVAMKSSLLASAERSVGRQATRIWDQHFVTCAICQTSSSKSSLNTKYCEECKGVVCSNCDCSVYHLSYQEKMWDEVNLVDAQEKMKKKKKKRNQKKKDKKSSTVTDKGEGSSEDEEDLQEVVKPSMEEAPQFTMEEKIAEVISDEDHDAIFQYDYTDDDEEEGDLVDYLQSTGSILAVAQKLGL